MPRIALVAVLVWAALSLQPAPARAAGDGFKAAYKKAFALYEEGRFDEAIVAFENAYVIEAEPLALYSIGRCHHLARRPGKAAAAYERFLSAAPDHDLTEKTGRYLMEALAASGNLKLLAREYTSARDAFRRALEVSGEEDPALLAGLGDALAGLGETETAGAALNRALKVVTDPDLHARIESALSALEPSVTDPDPEPDPDRRPDPDSRRPDHSPKEPAFGSGDVPPREATRPDRAPKRGEKRVAGLPLPTFLAIGSGAVGAVVLVIVIAVVATKPGRVIRAIDDYPEGNVIDLRTMSR